MFLEQLIGEGRKAAVEITPGFSRKRKHCSGHPQPHPHLIQEEKDFYCFQFFVWVCAHVWGILRGQKHQIAPELELHAAVRTETELRSSVRAAGALDC